MKRALLALLLVASPAFAQANGWAEMPNGWGEIQTVPGFTTIPPPASATLGCVGVFLGSPLNLQCDAGISYDAVTDTLTTGYLASGQLVRIGTGTATAAVGGVLHVNTTARATTGTTEQVLATYTLPANTLSAAGKAIRITAWGTTAANTNSKTVRIRLGGIGAQGVISMTTSTSAAVWRLEAVVARTGASTQDVIAWGLQGSNNVIFSQTTLTLSSANDIVVTGITATSAGDATFKGLIVEALN